MTVDRRALAATLATLLVVAACGGSASSAPGATQGPGSTVSPAATPGETTPAAETPEPSELPDVSLSPGSAGDLEAMLPDEAGGVKLQKTSFDGASYPGVVPLGDGSDDFTKFLSDNGKSVGDVRFAVATPVDTSAAGSTVMAIQIKGVSADKLLAFVAKDQSSADKSTIGGKEVYGSGEGGFGSWFYVKDDTVFYVLTMGGDASVAEEIMKQLP